MAKRSHGRQGLEARPKWTQGRTRQHGTHMADKVWRRGQKRTQGGHMANTWRGKFGDAAIEDLRRADTRRTRGGHMPDTRRTSSGTRPEHIAASLFFLRENPTVNCLGKNIISHNVGVSWSSKISVMHKTPQD